MTTLLLAALTFVLTHLLIAGTRVRDLAVARLGQGAYSGLYSLISAAALTWVGVAFGAARVGPDEVTLWTATPLTRLVQLALQFVAVLFVVIGLSTPNPTSVGQLAVLDRPDPVRGMLRITRHPFLWGVAMWAVGHLLVNGDLAGLVLFGAMLALALFGTASIDAKRRRLLGPRWAAFAAATSNIPFAAVIARRQTLRLGEIGLARPLAAVVVYVGLIAIHTRAFGVSPLP